MPGCPILLVLLQGFELEVWGFGFRLRVPKARFKAGMGSGRYACKEAVKSRFSCSPDCSDSQNRVADGFVRSALSEFSPWQASPNKYYRGLNNYQHYFGGSLL